MIVAPTKVAGELWPQTYMYSKANKTTYIDSSTSNGEIFFDIR